MSNETSSDSAERSGGIVDAVAPFLIENYESLDEGEKAIALSNLDHVIRKIAHFGVYTILGVLVSLVFLYVEGTWIFHAVLPILCGVLYAISDEIHQAFVPGRGPGVTDVIIDSGGVVCGTLFMIFIANIIITKRTRG